MCGIFCFYNIPHVEISFWSGMAFSVYQARGAQRLYKERLNPWRLKRYNLLFICSTSFQLKIKEAVPSYHGFLFTLFRYVV